jgi:hypothetical protein
MSEQFSSHRDYMAKVEAAAETRSGRIEAELRKAFASATEKEEVEVIDLLVLDANQLADILEKHPSIVKAVLSACNVAGRAIERDLGIKNFDTYNPRFSQGQALKLAEFLKLFLPDKLPLPALTLLDRIAFIDKEVRKDKGGWEKAICLAANKHGAPKKYKKGKFTCGVDSYELDAAAGIPTAIEVGIDVKRCEAKRDKHKRIDEIVNKAFKFKTAFPAGRFGVVIYYPFPDDQADFRARALSANIDGLVFANDDDLVIEAEVRALLEMMGVATPVPPTGSP